MLLQHDNARPHRSLKTQKAITEFGWTVLPHPPDSPHLASSDFHQLGASEDAICIKKFETSSDVILA
jgi:histone-lysine N-methyltransferase SETMAR